MSNKQNRDQIRRRPGRSLLRHHRLRGFPIKNVRSIMSEFGEIDRLCQEVVVKNVRIADVETELALVRHELRLTLDVFLELPDSALDEMDEDKVLKFYQAQTEADKRADFHLHVDQLTSVVNRWNEWWKQHPDKAALAVSKLKFEALDAEDDS